MVILCTAAMYLNKSGIFVHTIVIPRHELVHDLISVGVVREDRALLSMYNASLGCSGGIVN